MEDGVYFHRGRKVELISMRGDLLDNSKFTQALEIQFHGGSGGADVLAKKLDFVADLEYRGRGSMLVSLSCITSLCPNHLTSEMGIEIRELIREFLQDSRGGHLGIRVRVNLVLGVVTIVGKERRHASGC